MNSLSAMIVDNEKCVGCTVCVKSCPTEAIRLREGKAKILTQRCVDCARCLTHCHHRAIKSDGDGLTQITKYKYTVALPDPSLYGQFKDLKDPDLVLNALLEIGFDDVFDVAQASEYISFYVQNFKPKRSQLPMPRISCGCPVILRLIGIRFPDLIPNVVSVVTSLQLAAKLARKQFAEKTGLNPEEIGVFAIVPCPAQVTDSNNPLLLNEPVFDGAFAIKDIYPLLLDPMAELSGKKLQKLSRSGARGVSFSYVSGECQAQKESSYLAVDGLDNCITMLEEIDAGRFEDAEYIELATCSQGCVGGCFNVTNPYVAALRIRRMCENMAPYHKENTDYKPYLDDMLSTKKLEYLPVFLLDNDRSKAMEKMTLIEETAAMLPKLDCGSCGSPSCKALAEDVVMGKASLEDCIFRRKKKPV